MAKIARLNGKHPLVPTSNIYGGVSEGSRLRRTIRDTFVSGSPFGRFSGKEEFPTKRVK